MGAEIQDAGELLLLAPPPEEEEEEDPPKPEVDEDDEVEFASAASFLTASESLAGSAPRTRETSRAFLKTRKVGMLRVVIVLVFLYLGARKKGDGGYATR